MTDTKPIRRIAIVGTGVIGASWTTLFLEQRPDSIYRPHAKGGQAMPPLIPRFDARRSIGFSARQLAKVMNPR
jgi:hypothetical protein